RPRSAYFTSCVTLSTSDLPACIAHLVFRDRLDKLSSEAEAHMKKFLLLYRSAISSSEQMAKATPEQMKAGMDAWMQWAARASGAIVDLGSPTAEPFIVGTPPGAQAAGHVGGFSVLQADGANALRAVLEGHPHLMVPGNSIEVHEFLPMPGM